MGVPSKCPMCRDKKGWTKVARDKKGFSGAKAVVGTLVTLPLAIIATPLALTGALLGTTGKKYDTYMCKNCNFKHEYKK